MKKVFYAFILCLLFVGCGKMNNTPTKKVEAFFNNYQTLDKSVLASLDSVISDDYSLDQKSKYRDIVKKNYQKLTYKVKDEVIDGDKAIVTVTIDVIDYSKINNEIDLYLANHPNEFLLDNGEYDKEKANEYRLSKLKEAKEMVTYTLELELHKDGKDWILNDLDETELSKINGTYKY